jgi:hypothetical protein
MIAGSGLTHLGSAKGRQATYATGSKKEDAQDPAIAVTDSMRRFQWGVERGRPREAEIGIAPEWFYKGNGSILRGPFEALTVPPYYPAAERVGSALS